MRSKSLFWLLTTVLLTTAPSAASQQPTKAVPRIGFLTGATTAAMSTRTAAFRQGLRELGYVEGKNIVIEYRYAEGKTDRLNQLATELVQLKVDVIVTGGSQTTRPAKEATATIPIVMGNDNDPVGDGFVMSLARPGGNITGLANLTPEMSGKRLELLKEIFPKLSRVAVIGDASVPGNAQLLGETKHAAAAIGVQLEYLEVRVIADVETVFQAATTARADAVLVLPSAVFTSQRKHVVDLAEKDGSR